MAKAKTAKGAKGAKGRAKSGPVGRAGGTGSGPRATAERAALKRMNKAAGGRSAKDVAKMSPAARNKLAASMAKAARLPKGSFGAGTGVNGGVGGGG